MLKTKNNIFAKLTDYKQYFKELIILAWPILLGELGHCLIGATDILVIAKYNIQALAAVSIANALLFTIFILGLGILDSIPIILSNVLGTKQGVKKHLLTTLLFSLFISILFSLICYSTTFFIPKMGFEQALIPYINQYITIVSFSMFGMFLFQGLKGFLLAYEIVKFPNILLMVTVVVNLILDIILVLGFGPIPAMGVKGAALATLTVRTLMGIIMFFYVYRFINFKSKIDYSYVKQILKVGSPIGFGLMVEFLAFNIITLLVGREQGLYAATHNILMAIASTTFMFPLSISIAASVKVSYFYGAKKLLEIKRYALSSLYLGVGTMIFFATVLVLFPKELISIFTVDKQVMEIAIPIIYVVATYQIVDGIQVVMGGVLKGFKMTKTVSNIVLAGYWGFGMPVAYVLVTKYSMLLKGYWIALAVALSSMCIMMSAFVLYKFKKIKKMYTNI